MLQSNPCKKLVSGRVFSITRGLTAGGSHDLRIAIDFMQDLQSSLTSVNLALGAVSKILLARWLGHAAR